jgi:hypothetical protein
MEIATLVAAIIVALATVGLLVTAIIDFFYRLGKDSGSRDR